MKQQPITAVEKHRTSTRRSAARRKARDPEAEQLRERLKKAGQRMLQRAKRAMGWHEHSQKCPVCASTLAVSGDTPYMGRGVKRAVLRRVARSELGKAASVTFASGDDPMVNRVRMFLQALCPDGQRLLLPVLSSAGKATAPGTKANTAGLMFDVAQPDNDDLAAPFFARWARRDYLENPVYMDAPAVPEQAYEEWAWYEHRQPVHRLAGMDEARRCLQGAEALTLAIAQLPVEAQSVAQRIRRCGLLGAYGGWVDDSDLLGGLAWPAMVLTGLRQLRNAGLLNINRESNESHYSITSKEVIDEAAA